jgi:signal peptidase II
MIRKYLWIAVLVLVLDQLTKVAAADYFAHQMEARLAPFLSLVLVHNTGAAFGFLSSASGWQNIFFIVLATIASGAILWMMWRLDAKNTLVAIGLMLILGGALGNVTDRLMYGYVIDFIDIHYQTWHWPAFNVADSAITIGAVLLLLDATQVGVFKKH